MRLPDLHPKQEFGSRIDNLLVQKIVSIRIIKRSRASLRLILLFTGIYLIAFNRKPKIVRLTFLHVAIPIRGDMNDVK